MFHSDYLCPYLANNEFETSSETARASYFYSMATLIQQQKD